MRKLILTILLCLSFIPVVQAESADLKLEITVNGLVCDFCARAVEKVFKNEFELKSIGIDLSERLITVQLPAGTEISDEKIKELIVDSGYAFVAVKRNETGN